MEIPARKEWPTMRVTKWLGLIGFLAAIAISAAQNGCNAQSAAYGLFTSQGLNLLRPARDYIQPGGMVFVPKKGNPEYEDPKDDVGSEKGNLTDFRASILEETANKKTGLGAALSLATTIVPVPISAGAQSGKQVSLKQIDTTGLRLNTDALDRLIASPNTSKAAAAELQRGMRVFVVQEIYKATSLDLHAEDNKAFDLHFNDGKAVADCKLTNQSSSTKSDNAATDKKNSSTGTNAKDSSSTGSADKPAGSAAKGSGQTKTAPASSAQSKLGAGVALCVADDYTLKLTTKDPIPFAVRLAELEMSQGTVQRNRGSVLKGTLGGGEISAALVNKETPAIDRLRYRPKTQK
jgi:hypothetical protein